MSALPPPPYVISETKPSMPPLYRHEGTLRSAEWTFHPSAQSREETEVVASEGVYASKGGRLEGPAIPCAEDEFAFYRLRFQSRFTERGYYAVFFQDATGENQVDDIYGGVEPSTQWAEQEYCFRGREGGRTFRLQFISHGIVDVRDVEVERVTASEVRRWADRFYEDLPPLQYAPARERWEHLLRTMDRLRRGGVLRVVMLGDSIINDTNNSNWDALIGRQYPHCRIQVITSVRGSTGCWYYQEPEALKTYVIDRRPDLLIIGGISHRQDLDAIRKVILGAKQATDCEVLLMSGPMGADWRPYDPANPDRALAPATYDGDPFNERLAVLADETDVAFLDMNTVWHQYLAASGKPWRWFHRDAVHANDRGKQILARILERFFTPD